MSNTFSISYGTTAANTVTANSGYYTGISSTPAIQTYPTVNYGGIDLSKSFIGWDEQIRDLEKIGEKMLKNTGNFPPYNVVKEDDDTFLIEFAVAGFSKKDITVSQEKNALLIEGKIEEDKEKKYVHKGIATRSFSRAFALAEYVEVDSAEFENGILIVKLIREVPKEERPRQISIK